MAVAFSTGGSGYMRSDFMISDAAIPQRMEELSADQSDKFSQVLSGFSGKNEAPVDASKTVERFTGSDGKVDMHALAKAVADGEVKLEDIPTELLTQELFTELTKLVEVPEKEDGEPAREAAMAELAALFTAQQTVQPEQVSDKSGEMTELSQPTVEAVQAPVVTQAQPEQPQTVQAQPGQAAQPQESPISFAARSISLSDWILMPERTSPSGIFGVMTSARGKSSFFIRSGTPPEASAEPLVATRTGSTTMCLAW